MQSFSLQINGLDTLIKDSQKIGGQLPGLLLQTMVKITTIAKNKAREIRPGSFKNRTGTLRRSIERDVQSAARGVVYVGEKYGEYVEFGTKPHTISPKNRKMLAFKVNGVTVFARKVKHPGGKPYPYMQPAFEETAPLALDEYAKVADIVVKTMAGL